MPEHIGLRIKWARKRKGLSQDELAKLVNVSQPTVANWEKGIHAPRHTMLSQVASTLGEPTSWLLGDSLRQAPEYLAGPPSQDLSSANNSHDFNISRITPSSHSAAPYTPRNDQHHIPVLDWPETPDALDRAGVRTYISTTIMAQRPLALKLPDRICQQLTFTPMTILIFDRADHQLKDGVLYLLNNIKQNTTEIAYYHLSQHAFSPTLLEKAGKDSIWHKIDDYNILGKAVMVQQEI